jgi:hypothetical protein
MSAASTATCTLKALLEALERRVAAENARTNRHKATVTTA